jgi:ribosomal protein S18 acetylase RimI-like enzyme
MSLQIKRLGPGDEATLDLLAREDADFDLEGRGAPLAPLKPGMARAYLASPSVLHWVALEESVVTGFLYCSHLLLRSDAGQELLLYEIGVRSAWRRQGVGRALLNHMEGWMKSNDVSVVWVCADNEIAVDFYRATGFSSEDTQPVYMTRELVIPPKNRVSTLLSV